MKKILIVLNLLISGAAFAADGYKAVECQVGDVKETQFYMYSKNDPEYFGVDLTGGLTFEVEGYGVVRLGGYIGSDDSFVVPGKMIRNENNVSNVYLALENSPGRLGSNFRAELTFEVNDSDTVYVKVLNCKKLDQKP